jgi:carboxylesterase
MDKSLLRRMTGLGGERPFRDVSGLAGTEPLVVEGRTPTVLCIHGFTGVPKEVELGCEVAEILGLAARAPLLPGHGTSALQLSKTSYPDWLAAAREVFDEVRTRGPVVLIGLSLGSLIATELTLNAPGDVAGLVVISPAFWLKSPHPALTLRAAFALGLGHLYMDKSGPDLGDPEARRTHITYDAQPLHSATSVEAAGRRLRGELFRLNRPTLILHGALDRVCPVRGASRMAQALGTTDVKVRIFPHSHHILTRDSEKDQVREEMRQFIARF